MAANVWRRMFASMFGGSRRSLKCAGRRRPGFERLERRALLSASGDFNGDGFDDLAIGAPRENVAGVVDAGAVHVLYGGSNGLRAAGNQLWTQESPGINSVARAGERFGTALSVGDFDGDGFDDLAIGVPNEAVDGEINAGAVNIIYGSATGLRANGDQLWTRNSSGVNGVANVGDGFGRTLATGDFDGDGHDDLAIGAQGDNAGSVTILYGRPSGLHASGDQLWTQNSSGINGVANGGEEFGSALAAGDFDGNGRDDLAIGVRSDQVSGSVGSGNAGSVNVIYGSSGGLTAAGDQLWNQQVAGVSGISEGSDRFGEALAVGKFNGDAIDDLAIGAPGGNVGGDNDAGEVNILYGSAAKIQIAGEQLITRDSLGGSSVLTENFGAALAAGNFIGSGRDGLAIGAPGATLGGIDSVGYVQLVYGSPTGLTASGAQFINQNTAGVFGVNEAFDRFGESLSTGDYDNDGRTDLAVGVPGQTLGGLVFAGQVAVLRGATTGITADGNRVWNAGSTGILGSVEADAVFGGTLA